MHLCEYTTNCDPPGTFISFVHTFCVHFRRQPILIKNENENNLNQICKENITPSGLYFDGLSANFVQPLIVLP